MLEGFKKFILRGNVVDMAVGVVVGAAFGGVVTALTKDLLTPLISAVVGKPDFSSIGFTIASTPFPVGDFINAVVSFLLIAAAIYFFVVTPVNALMARMHKDEPGAAPIVLSRSLAAPPDRTYPQLCSFCQKPAADHLLYHGNDASPPRSFPHHRAPADFSSASFRSGPAALVRAGTAPPPRQCRSYPVRRL